MTNIIPLIPPEALEAAVKNSYERHKTDAMPSWAFLSRDQKTAYIDKVRAACLAMLRNWPGFIETHTLINAEKTPVIILPLPQETKDD